MHFDVILTKMRFNDLINSFRKFKMYQQHKQKLLKMGEEVIISNEVEYKVGIKKHPKFSHYRNSFYT